MIETNKSTKRLRRTAREPGAITPTLKPTSIEIPSPSCTRQTKASLVEQMLTRAEGASLEQLCLTTGWQAHTCRAFLTGLRKTGKLVTRSKTEDGASFYRLMPAALSEEIADAVLDQPQGEV